MARLLNNKTLIADIDDVDAIREYLGASKLHDSMGPTVTRIKCCDGTYYPDVHHGWRSFYSHLDEVHGKTAVSVEKAPSPETPKSEVRPVPKNPRTRSRRSTI